MVEKKDFRREELPKKYTAKILDNGKFKNKYLKKLEKNWNKWKGKDKMIQKNEARSSSGSRNLEGGVMSDI